MKKVKRLGLVLAAASLWAGAAAPLYASDNGTVDAQVTVATPCITITTPSTGIVDFGSLPFSGVGNDVIGQTTVSYANCSSADERIWGAGRDATGPGATWFLAEPPGTVCVQGLNRYDLFLTGTAWSSYLAVPPRQLQTLGDGEDSGPVALNLIMPCVGSDGVGQTMSFQVIFTATF